MMVSIDFSIAARSTRVASESTGMRSCSISSHTCTLTARSQAFRTSGSRLASRSPPGSSFTSTRIAWNIGPLRRNVEYGATFRHISRVVKSVARSGATP